jgi:hypothetical protein
VRVQLRDPLGNCSTCHGYSSNEDLLVVVQPRTFGLPPRTSLLLLIFIVRKQHLEGTDTPGGDLSDGHFLPDQNTSSDSGFPRWEHLSETDVSGNDASRTFKQQTGKSCDKLAWSAWYWYGGFCTSFWIVSDSIVLPPPPIFPCDFRWISSREHQQGALPRSSPPLIFLSTTVIGTLSLQWPVTVGGHINNNNNTLIWSGPRGVVGCTGQARVARLWQAPHGPTGPLCAIEPAESLDSKKTSSEEKDNESGFGRVPW